MIALVIALVAVAAAAILVAPTLLRGRWVVRRPRAAIALWTTAFATGAVALAASILVAVAGALTAGGARATASGWLPPVALSVLGWLGLGATGALVALVVTRADDAGRAGRRTGAAVTLQCALGAYRWERLRGVEVCFVDADAVTAFATRAGGRRIVVSRRVELALSAAELRAVLEHEVAHLSGGHDLLLGLARLNRACFPGLAGARAFERTASLLIELIADDVAARRCGAATTAGALEAMRALDDDCSLELRARRLAALRPEARGPLSAPGRRSAGAASWRRPAPTRSPSSPPRSAG